MKKKFFTISLVVLLISVSFFIGFSAVKSNAQLSIPFGGRLILYMECTCSFDTYEMFYEGVPGSSFSGGTLTYSFLTTLYDAYNVETPDVWHLGLYSPVEQICWMDGGEDCYIEYTDGGEIMMGTSG